MSEKVSEQKTVSEKKNDYMEHELIRDGKTPLVFIGRQLGTVNTRIVKDGPNVDPDTHLPKRWDEYTLYVTTGGKYVLEHSYESVLGNRYQGLMFEGRTNHEAWYDTNPIKLLNGAMFCGILPAEVVQLAKMLNFDIAEHIK